MHRTRFHTVLLTIVVLSAMLGAACNTAPTQVASLNGVFQLAVLDGLPLPVFLLPTH
jgi:hypothetical protein